MSSDDFQPPEPPSAEELAELENGDPLCELRKAARELYMAGRWECATIAPSEAASLWEVLRDAAGIPVGTASAAGVGADTYDAAKHEAIYP